MPLCISKASVDTAVQFSSVQSLDRSGRWGNMRDNSAEILFQSFLQEALVSSSGKGKDVHSLMLSNQHFLCRPRRFLPSKMPWKVVLERLSWRVTCKNLQVSDSWQMPEKVSVDPQGSWPYSAPSRWSCGPSRRYGEVSSCTWFRKPGLYF